MSEPSRAWLTIPNALSILRLIGSLFLPLIAWRGDGKLFAIALVVLWLTDWLDGKLAWLFDQRTILGARLDTCGDVALYTALIPSVLWLRPDFFATDWPLAAATLGAYLTSGGASAWKFKRWPAYHTRVSKMGWLLAGVGAVLVFRGGPDWPARVAMGASILSSLEGIAITLLLPGWRANVPSAYHAWRDARIGDAPEEDPC